MTISVPTIEKPTINRVVGRDKYDLIVIHATRGPGSRPLQQEYEATINWFLNPASQVSAHFVVGPMQICRMVNDGDTAWHAGEINRRSLGIEVAQPSTQPEFLDFQYKATATIVREWCDVHGIPIRRVMTQNSLGIIGHEDSEQGKRSGKTDPGPRWDWDRFMGMVKGGGSSLSEQQTAELRPLLDIGWGNANEIARYTKLLSDPDVRKKAQALGLKAPDAIQREQQFAIAKLKQILGM